MLLILCTAALAALHGAAEAFAVESAPAPAARPGTLTPIPASRAMSHVAIITIQGEIDGITTHSVERRINQAIDAGADGIVFEIHSPGGMVDEGLRICGIIKRCTVPTIAWVNTEAYSMAAVIALACDSIVLAPRATLGDAAPILIGTNILNPGGLGLQSLGETERQKIMAPLIAEVVESARHSGYDENLVQGFITLGVELWLIRDKDSGERYFVTEAEYRAVFGETPPRANPQVPSGVFGRQDPAPESAAGPQAAPNPEQAEPTSFRPAFDSLTEETRKTLDEDLRLRGAPSTRPWFTRADNNRYELEGYVTDGKTLLTLKEPDLKRYGLADASATVASDQDLQQYVGASHVVRLDQSWSEHMVGFMTQGASGWVIKILLIVVFLIAMFVEMSMPGVGLPGVIALVALAGLVVPPMLIGASNWWMGALVVGGLLFIMFEIFVLPGFGVPGVIGLMMLFAGLIGTFAAPGQLFPGVGPGGAGELARALSVVVFALLVAGVGVYLFVRHTHKFPVFGRLVLADRQPLSDEESDGLLAAMAPTASLAGPVGVGAVGLTTTPLRPSGTAEFDDRLVDVVSEFGFIAAGQRVRVVNVNEYRVGVESCDDPRGAGTAPPRRTNPMQES